MSIDVFYLEQGRGVIIKASNIVSGKEVIAALGKIVVQHQIVPQQYHIIDKSWCTEYDITANDIEAISNLDKKIAVTNPDFIVAIIESKTLKYSLTDVWKAYVETFIKHIHSFNNQIEAKQWIDQLLSKKNNQGID